MGGRGWCLQTPQPCSGLPLQQGIRPLCKDAHAESPHAPLHRSSLEWRRLFPLLTADAGMPVVAVDLVSFAPQQLACACISLGRSWEEGR